MKRQPIPFDQWVFRNVAVGDWVTRFGNMMRVTRVTPQYVCVGCRMYRRDTGEGGRWNPGAARPATPEEIESHEHRAAADAMRADGFLK